MEELRKKHRQEQKDLESRIMQRRKTATKKTRKGVNDQCASLERQLKERQDLELSRLDNVHDSDGSPSDSGPEEVFPEKFSGDVESSISTMKISSTAAQTEQIRKPNRQKIRLARRAAEQEAAVKQANQEADSLPNLRDQELESMRQEFTSRNLIEKAIQPDGHCLYAAVADQLENSGIGLKPSTERLDFHFDKQASNPGYKITRQVAASFISHNSDDFLPFLEEPLEDYVNRVRGTGEWGGHLELLALAKAYGADINVLQGNGKVERIESNLTASDKQLWLSYYHHSYGLGEHYNSLRPSK